eukprot:5017347-Prymnesium_polylepis.1
MRDHMIDIELPKFLRHPALPTDVVRGEAEPERYPNASRRRLEHNQHELGLTDPVPEDTCCEVHGIRAVLLQNILVPHVRDGVHACARKAVEDAAQLSFYSTLPRALLLDCARAPCRRGVAKAKSRAAGKDKSMHAL